MKDMVSYFGYGANAHPEMIKALIGRVPQGAKAQLKQYGLFVQSWLEIPPEAKEILKKWWDAKFSSYIAVPMKGEVTWGVVWKLTKEERAIIGEWEMHHKWYLPVKVKVTTMQGKTVLAQTEIIPHFYTRVPAIQGKNYVPFVSNKAKMLKVARNLRKEILKTQPAP